MKRQFTSILGVGVLTIVASIAMGARAGSTPNQTALVARGKYIVENVANCADCHTPMTPDGRPDMSRWLMGSELVFKPTVPIPGWSEVAPAIAGLPGWDDDEAVALLTKATMPDGSPPAPPMPRFHMNEDDARSVVAYLRSLVATPH